MIGLLAVAGLVLALWTERYDRVLTVPVLHDFPAIVGLPFVFLAAFIVVSLFRQSEGAVGFKTLGVEFTGAAGQAVLWLPCLLSITAAVCVSWEGHEMSEIMRLPDRPWIGDSHPPAGR